MFNKLLKPSIRFSTQSSIKAIKQNKIENQNTIKLLSDSLQFVDVNYFSKKNKVFVDCYNQKIAQCRDPHLLSSIKIYYSISFNDNYINILCYS